MNPEEARKILGPDKIIGATCNTMEDIRLRANSKSRLYWFRTFPIYDDQAEIKSCLGS